MKQPQKPDIQDGWDGIFGQKHFCVWLHGVDENQNCVSRSSFIDLSVGRNRKAALSAAARRLRSLARECERMAERGE